MREEKEQVTYAPTDSTWCIVARVEGRRYTLETDEEGQTWESKGEAFFVYNVERGESAILAIDQSTGLPTLTIDEASRFVDTSEIKRAIRRSRHRSRQK